MAVKLPGDACEADWILDRELETAPPEEARARAGAAWRVQLAHLRADSPFAARRLRQAGVGDGEIGLADLAAVPFTTKDDLRAAIDERPPFGSNAAVAPERIKRVYQTSGTTGAPALLALTAADVEAWTRVGARTYTTAGVHAHHAVLSVFGAGPFVAGHTHLALARIGCRTVPVGPGDTERVRFAMRAGIVDTLLLTPSFAQHLAGRIAEDEARGVGHAITGGEPGGGIPAIREHLQARLGAVVTEVMGIGDVAPSLFGECPLQRGMHFCGQDHVWPELVDVGTRAPLGIETGAVGELVYTHLAREAMPMLRFLSGDVVRIEGTACACGRTGFLMRCIGRRDDMFIVRGVNVFPTAILAVVGELRPRVTGRARVVRPADRVAIEPPVPVQVEVPGDAIDPALAAEIERLVRARLTFRCAVELVPEGGLGDPAYKTRLSVTPA